MELISVIVPIYNVELYLDRCINSIINQSYRNLEIILVDDGSPDKCPEMCDEWAKKDSRIKVIHKDNGGLSDARNAGLAVASGSYISFVDSDDWIHTDFITHLYDAIKKHNSNLSACDVVFIDSETTTPIPFKEIVATVFTPKDAINTLIHGQGFRAAVWNKLYHKDLLSDQEFIVGKYHEDEFFTYKILAKSINPVYINAQLYNYFQRNSGIVSSVSEKHIDSLEAFVERLSFLKINYPELYKIDLPGICISCVNLYLEGYKLPDSVQQRYSKQIKYYRKMIKVPFSLFKQYTFKEQIYIVGSNKSLISQFCKILNFKRSK